MAITPSPRQQAVSPAVIDQLINGYMSAKDARHIKHENCMRESGFAYRSSDSRYSIGDWTWLFRVVSCCIC